MPTSSSLVTNLPADFNTFGQGVDTSLQDLLGGTTGQVLSKTSNTNMDFTWVTPTDQTPLTTKGDLFTFSTVDARLGVGTNGQTLVADSSTSTGLKWATPSGGGKVLQVVQGTSTTRVDIASTTYTDSGLSLSITPTLATSKILVLVSQQARTYRANTETGARVKMLRGATDIWNSPTSPSVGFFVGAGSTSGLNLSGFQSFIYLDSPATTSATTYKTQWRVEVTTNSSEVSLQVDSNMSTITLMEIGA
jgi:hypothetical protein